MTSTLISGGLQVRVLFNSGVIHSLIFKKFSTLLNKPYCLLESPLIIITLDGKALVTIHMLKTCAMLICSCLMSTNLILMDITNYDIILGMN